MADIFSNSINPTIVITSAPKKRVNRYAKLKQCKPNACRERWLSQGVVKNNGSKEDLTGHKPVQCDNNRKNLIKSLETGPSDRGKEVEKESGWVFIGFDFASPSNSLTDISILSSVNAGFTFTSSSKSSSGCFSGNIADEEEVNDSFLVD